MKGGLFGFGESDSSVPNSGSSMFGSIGDTLSGFGTSLSEGAKTALEKTKKVTGDAYDSATGSTTSSSSYVPALPSTPPATTTSFGGKNKRRKRSRKMSGGYSDNIAVTGLAARAAPISDIKSSQPLNIVGGRRTKKRRRHRHGKSSKRCKY
jgi:hypothetical protein